MGKVQFQMIAVKQDWPKLGDLFALCNRIGRDKADAGPSLVDIGPCLHEPRADKIQRSA